MNRTTGGGAFSLYFRGIAAAGGWRILILLYVAATVAALPLFLPIQSMIGKTLSGTRAGEILFANEQPGGGLIFVDLVRELGRLGMSRLFAVSAILTVLFQIVLAGGLADAAGRSPRPFFGTFFAACGRNLQHSIRCLVLFVGSMVVIPGGWFAVTQLVQTLALESATDSAQTGFLIFRLIGLLLLSFFVVAVYDLARALRRTDPFIGALRAWRRAGGIALRRPFSIVVLVALWAATAILIWGGLSYVELSMAPRSAAAVVMVLLLQQLAILGRCAVRLGAWGSVGALVDALPPVVAPSPRRAVTYVPKVVPMADPVIADADSLVVEDVEVPNSVDDTHSAQRIGEGDAGLQGDDEAPGHVFEDRVYDGAQDTGDEDGRSRS